MYVRVHVCGIRSKMALYFSNITDIVFFRVCTYPPSYAHKFFSLSLSLMAEIEALEVSDVFIDVLIDRFKRGSLRAGAGEQRKPLHSRSFSKGPQADLGVNGKTLTSQRVFPPTITRFSHRNLLVVML